MKTCSSTNVCALLLIVVYWVCSISVPIPNLPLYPTSEYPHRIDVIDCKISTSPRESLIPVHHWVARTKGGVSVRLVLISTQNFRLCKTCATDETCLGILLTHSDNNMEALGEIRFDKHLSESVCAQEWGYSNQRIDEKLYVLTRAWSDICESCSSIEWQRFPTEGKVVWWCGRNGNQIEVLGW